MIEISQLFAGYGKKMVVEDISFTVEDGEKVCIIGPNGCGKSTLLKAIVGLIDHTGDIIIHGKKLKQMKRKDIAQQIAFMSQNNGVYFSYTVWETVLLGRYVKEKGVFGKPTEQEEQFVLECMDAVGIAHLKDRMITDLSGGELQRVFLARVFAQDPKIIMLDEPTNHLDLKYQIELMEHLDKWSVRTGNIVVAVLHDINLALGFADRILLLSEGKVVSYGQKEELLKTKQLSEVYGLDVKEYMLHSYQQWNV